MGTDYGGIDPETMYVRNHWREAVGGIIAIGGFLLLLGLPTPDEHIRLVGQLIGAALWLGSACYFFGYETGVHEERARARAQRH